MFYITILVVIPLLHTFSKAHLTGHLKLVNLNYMVYKYVLLYTYILYIYIMSYLYIYLYILNYIV